MILLVVLSYGCYTWSLTLMVKQSAKETILNIRKWN